MTDRLVLAMDGSTRMCGAALLRLGEPAASRGRSNDPAWEVVARRAQTDVRGQARLLLSLVDEMLREVGGGPGDLGAVVVGTGPGTFTGVRITVATARALGLALSIPVLGISTLAALAAGATTVAEETSRSLLVPVVDARRDQVFFGIYESAGRTASGSAVDDDPGDRWVRSSAFRVCDREALGRMVLGPALVVGEDRALVGTLGAGVAFGATQVQAERLILGQQTLDEAEEAPQGSRLTPWLIQALGASGVGAFGWERSVNARPGEVGAPEGVRPIYVRSPDADIHITKMKNPWAASLQKQDGSVGGRGGE